MTIHKQSVGLDISKKTFTACICTLATGQTLSFSEVKSFDNEKRGFNQLIRWVRKQCIADIETVFLMEATGVYHERIAQHLCDLKQTVHVALPNKSKHYFASLNIKSKTDAIDARVLSQFGAERSHKPWNPPSPTLLKLRDLTRYYVQLMEQKTALGNFLEGKEQGHEVESFILKSNKKLIKQVEQQLTGIKKQVDKVLSGDPPLKERIDKVATIKGVGVFTVVTIVAETLGFEHFNSIRQVVSYAGYDVVQNESGTSVKGKTRISKKGNRYIRNALYFPAMVACRYNETMKANYLRIIQKKPSKMIGQVAIQRKLLALIYTLWKNNTVYDDNYQKEVTPVMTTEATLGSS